MTINVALHIRTPRSGTNFRSEVIAAGLEAAGATITKLSREEPAPPGTDIVLQTGFAPTPALCHAIDNQLPYILGECPVFRHLPGIDYNNWVSWGYNGLMGGAWHPKAPNEEIWTPELKPFKKEGPNIIFAQKPNDRSLRGHDHNVWIDEKLIEYPDAEFRPHPLMTSKRLEPIADAMRRCYHAITFSSTAGGEALLEGCVSFPEHWGSTAYNVLNREEWLHERSWHGFPLTEITQAKVGAYILSGFEEARDRALKGLVEKPRLKVTVDMHQYTSTDPRVLEWR